jgi:superfamily II RNA helicase
MELEAGVRVLDLPFRVRARMRRERSPSRLLDWLQRERLLPVLFFCFSRKDCEALALENRDRRLLQPAEMTRMAELFDDLAARYELSRTDATVQRLRQLAMAGVAWHHAGMLPIHKEVVERLFTSGLLRILFATETFALGVNMPARTVAFHSLRKFDGERMDYMLCRAYGQMAGRAGRQGIDAHGLVVSMLDPRMDRGKGVRRVLTGRAEPVVSRWNPEYATILSLYRHLGDRVLASYEKSFAKFQRERRRGAHGGRSDEEKVMAARLAVLREAGYLETGKLTDKGAFACRINGYEVHAAEFRDAGFLERLDARGLGALLLAAAYEPRPDEMTSPPRDRRLGGVLEESLELIARWRSAEWEAGLTDLTKEPHFGLTAVLEAWIDGRPLAECAKVTTAGEGDIVRWFRLMLQYARQIRKALPAPGAREEAPRRAPRRREPRRSGRAPPARARPGPGRRRGAPGGRTAAGRRRRRRRGAPCGGRAAPGAAAAGARRTGDRRACGRPGGPPAVRAGGVRRRTRVAPSTRIDAAPPA